MSSYGAYELQLGVQGMTLPDNDHVYEQLLELQSEIRDHSPASHQPREAQSEIQEMYPTNKAIALERPQDHPAEDQGNILPDGPVAVRSSAVHLLESQDMDVPENVIIPEPPQELEAEMMELAHLANATALEYPQEPMPENQEAISVTVEPSPAPTSRKRKRSQKDDSRSSKSKKKAKKQKPKTKKRRGMIDLAYYDDNEDPICPLIGDFAGPGALRREYYRWEIAVEAIDSKIPDSETAPPPWVPDFLDDEKIPNPMDEERKRKARTNSQEGPRNIQRSERGPKKPAEPKPDPGRPRPTLADMPPEVVAKILRHLVVGDKPILVFGGWKMTYLRGQPELHTSILSVMRRFYVEGTRILYGENTFLYRLRDATNEVPDLEELNKDEELCQEGDSSDESDSDFHYGAGDEEAEEEIVDSDSDADSEYQPDGPSAARRAQPQHRTKRPQARDWNIDFDRFKPLIRHIIVEAERNRFSRGQKLNMARALQAFIPEQPEDTGAGEVDARPNIHTLGIRVWPSLIFDTTFSFVDFFAPDGPIIKAITEIECQRFRIELQSRFLVPNGDPGKTKYYRIDMRNYRMLRRGKAGLAEASKNDQALWWHLRRSENPTVKTLHNLQRLVRRQCNDSGPQLEYDFDEDEMFFVWKAVRGSGEWEDGPDVDAE